jgi:RNA polymerase sigma-70 factor (ECF subfamily)
MEPSAKFEQDIHQRLLAGDPIASSELATAYLAPLARWLQRHFRHVQDEHLIFDAATDALLNYSENPTRFDPTKSRLLNYLRMSARRDLLNTLQKEWRKSQREQRTKQKMRADPVELRPRSGNVLQEDDDQTVAAQHLMQHILAVLTDPRDQKLLQLILDGERKTAVYADVLGLQDRDEAEQRRIVKRHKDRLKKRLERLGAKPREHTSPE